MTLKGFWGPGGKSEGNFYRKAIVGLILPRGNDLPLSGHWEARDSKNGQIQGPRKSDPSPPGRLLNSFRVQALRTDWSATEKKIPQTPK